MYMHSAACEVIPGCGGVSFACQVFPNHARLYALDSHTRASLQSWGVRLCIMAAGAVRVAAAGQCIVD